MRTLLALTRRELEVYFVSPLAYIILTLILFFSGLGFYASVKTTVAAHVPGDYGGTLLLLEGVVVLTAALVTMRLVAEEKSRGTIEMLLTAPVTEMQVVAAKFAGAVCLLAFLIVPTFGFALILGQYGSVDIGQVLCGYLGVLLLGSALYSIGIFISSLCSSQLVAGMITFVVVLLLLIANIFWLYRPDNSLWRQLLDYVSLMVIFGDFMKGVVDSSRVVYLLSISVFFLFLTARLLETRRWR